MSENDERAAYLKCHRHFGLNFKARVSSSISELDEKMKTSNQHTWRSYRNIKVQLLASSTFSIVFMAIFKTYETPDKAVFYLSDTKISSFVKNRTSGLIVKLAVSI
jgi:hypothetical protein